MTEGRKTKDGANGNIGIRALAVVLIALGVVWLLGQFGAISVANAEMLYRLLPILLIVVGAALVFGRHAPRLAARAVTATVILVGVGMFILPSFGIGTQAAQATVHQFTGLRDGATRAEIDLGLGVGTSTVGALEAESDDLFQIDIRTLGQADIRIDRDDDTQSIRLSQSNEGGTFFNLPFLNIRQPDSEDDLYTYARIAPGIPLDLSISAGVGTAVVDLSALTITALEVNSGVGEVDLRLPAAYIEEVSLNSGVGTLRITVPSGAAFEMDISGGVGDTIIDLPEEAPIRITVNAGLNSAQMPSFLRAAGDNEWESAAYDDADDEARIEIDFDGGIGTLIIR
jgi:hypothetical protein